MNLRLLRSDPAWRALRAIVPIVTLFAALDALFVDQQLGRYAETIERFNPGFVDQAARMIVVCVLVAVLASVFAEGMLLGPLGEFGLALPVERRALVAHRIVAMVALAWLPLASATAAVALIASSPRFLEKVAVAGGNLAATLLASVLLWVLLALRGPRWPWVGFAAVGLSGIASAFAMTAPTPIPALVACGIAVPLGWSVYRAAGESRALDESRRRADSLDVLRSAPSGRAVWRAFAARNTALYWPSALFGTTVTGAVVATSAYSGAGSTLGYLLAYAFVAGIALDATQTLRKIAHLPIPRARVLPWIALPSLAYLLLGALGSDAVHTVRARPGLPAVDLRLVTDASGAYVPEVVVPREQWRLAAPEPPRVEAPWGESVRPRGRTFLPGLPLRAYNPFEVHGSSSERFVAWQLERAIRAVYGAGPTAAEIDDRFLEESALGSVWRPPQLAESWKASLPPRIGWDGRSVLTGLTVLTLLWAVVLFFALGPNAPPATRSGRRRHLRIGALSVLALSPVVLELALVSRAPETHATFRGITFSLLRAALPRDAALGALLLGAIVATALLVLARRFRSFEPSLAPVDERRPGMRAFLNA